MLTKCLNKLHGFLPKELTEMLYRLQGFTMMVATCEELEEFVEFVNKNEDNGNNILFGAVLKKMSLKIISISLGNRLSSFVVALEDFAHHFPDERNLEIINLCRSQETLQNSLVAGAKDAAIVTALGAFIGIVIVVIPFCIWFGNVFCHSKNNQNCCRSNILCLLSKPKAFGIYSQNYFKFLHYYRGSVKFRRTIDV